MLHVRTVNANGGGPDKTVLRSPAGIDPQRYRMEVAYIHPAKSDIADRLRNEAERFGCPLHLLGESHGFDPRTIWRLGKLCRRLGVNIWHAHDYKSNLFGLLIREVHPMKMVSTAHGWVDKRWRPRLYEQIDFYCLPRYDRVITVSEDIEAQCRELGVEPDRLCTIHNAIDLDEWQWPEKQAQARWELELPDDALILGTASRLNHEKGIDRLLPVLARLCGKLPKLRYLAIGEGPAERSLKAQAQALGLSDRIIWAGWQKPLHRWYRAMDALVMPSRAEGLPNTLLEAMALGVPVAATDVGGIAGLLEGGRSGMILHDDCDRWVDYIENLLTNHNLRKELVRRAAERLHDRHSFTRRMQRIMACYDSLTDTTPPRNRPITSCQQAA